jgi:DNA-binding GntR family transcriptional regulator
VIPAAPKRDSELAYEKIVDMLLDEAIPENFPLSERNLSKSLGLGRTPIREAVRDLVREGVLESHPIRGTLVRPLSVPELQDLYEIRLAIEGLAVSLAVERGPVEELEPFAIEFDRVLRGKGKFDAARIHEGGISFHEEIIRLSGNRSLIEFYRPFRLRFRIPLSMVHHRTPERVRKAVAEHKALVTALMKRDGKEAATLMRDHLRRGLDFRIGLLLNRHGDHRGTMLNLPQGD